MTREFVILIMKVVKRAISFHMNYFSYGEASYGQFSYGYTM